MKKKRIHHHQVIVKTNPRRFKMNQLPLLILILPIIAFMLLPLLYIFNQAFKPFDELIQYPPRFFVTRPTFDNFIELFRTYSSTSIPISRYLFNSIIITVVVVFLSIFLSSITGFALSKMRFHIKKVIFEVNTIALMFVGTAVSIPRYVIIDAFGLIDTFWVNIIPLLVIPVGLFLIKQFIDDIPDELIEAARIDGANDFQIYLRIVLPLIKPAIATIAILAFQTAWNNIETSSIYVNSEQLKTFAYYMSTLSTSSNTVAGKGMAAAATLIMFLPNLIIFIFLQSRVMNTMAHSGIK